MKTPTKTASQAVATAEEQLEGFIDKFDSKNAALIRSARRCESVYHPPTNWPTTTTTSSLSDFFDRATVRLHRFHCRRRERSWAVVLLWSHAPRSAQVASRRRQPKPFHQDQVGDDTGASRGRGIDCRCHRTG